MKIGEIYKGVINNCLIQIIGIDNKRVHYKNLDNGKIFSYGIKAFEHCNLIKIN